MRPTYVVETFREGQWIRVSYGPRYSAHRKRFLDLVRQGANARFSTLARGEMLNRRVQCGASEWNAGK